MALQPLPLRTTLAIPTEANAATPTETAVVQNIVGQNDNQGKQFIVADKQAGTLTMYTASGQQITSTPALSVRQRATACLVKIRPADDLKPNKPMCVQRVMVARHKY